MDELARQINESIKNSDVYKRYLHNKNCVENNEQLKKIKEEMKLLKEENCKERNEETILKYYDLERVYSGNIVVKEFENSRREFYDLLVDVCDILWFK